MCFVMCSCMFIELSYNGKKKFICQLVRDVWILHLLLKLEEQAVVWLCHLNITSLWISLNYLTTLLWASPDNNGACWVWFFCKGINCPMSQSEEKDEGLLPQMRNMAARQTSRGKMEISFNSKSSDLKFWIMFC